MRIRFEEEHIPSLPNNGENTPYFSVMFIDNTSSFKKTRCHDIFLRDRAKSNKLLFILDPISIAPDDLIPRLTQFFEMIQQLYNIKDTISFSIAQGRILVEANQWWTAHGTVRSYLLLKLLRIAWRWNGETLGQAIERFAHEEAHAENKLVKDWIGMINYIFYNGPLLASAERLLVSSAVFEQYKHIIQCREKRLPYTVH